MSEDQMSDQRKILLYAIQSFGLDRVKVSEVYRRILPARKSITDFISSEEINNAQKNYGDSASRVLDVIREYGMEFVAASFAHNSRLEFCFKNNVFTQKEVDEANRVYQENAARAIILLIENNGLAFVKATSLHTYEYGLERNIFNEAAVNAAQEKYASRKPPHKNKC